MTDPQGARIIQPLRSGARIVLAAALLVGGGTAPDGAVSPATAQERLGSGDVTPAAARERLAGGDSTPAMAQERLAGGDATLYIGTYEEVIVVIDEATETVVGKIELSGGIPRGLMSTPDDERLYIIDAAFENVEIVDLSARRSIDTFTLSEPNKKVRLRGGAVDPRERFLVLLATETRKLTDRFEIGEPTLLLYDLASRRVSREIPWPDDEERQRVRLMFSPDGDLLYLFGDDIVVLETGEFTEVDRWDLSEPLEAGMGRFGFGFPESPYEETGYFTGLFRTRDPVQGRQLMGVARVDLAERDVDFFTLGPSMSVSFSLAPGRKKAYGLLQQIGHYEFWTFDLEGRRVESRHTFAGRPRMRLTPSSNGKLLYIHEAGNTIDVYEAATYQYLRTLTLDGDQTTDLVVVPPSRERPPPPRP